MSTRDDNDDERDTDEDDVPAGLLLRPRPSLSIASSSSSSTITAHTGMSIRLPVARTERPGGKAAAGAIGSRQQRRAAARQQAAAGRGGKAAAPVHSRASPLTISLAIVAHSSSSSSSSPSISFVDVEAPASVAPLETVQVPPTEAAAGSGAAAACAGGIAQLASTSGAENFVAAVCGDGSVHAFIVTGWTEPEPDTLVARPKVRVAHEFSVGSITHSESTWDAEGPHGGARHQPVTASSSSPSSSASSIARIVSIEVYQKHRSVLYVVGYEAGLIRVLARNGSELYRVHASSGGGQDTGIDGPSPPLNTAESVPLRSMAVNPHATHLSSAAVATEAGEFFSGFVLIWINLSFGVRRSVFSHLLPCFIHHSHHTPQ